MVGVLDVFATQSYILLLYVVSLPVPWHNRCAGSFRPSALRDSFLWAPICRRRHRLSTHGFAFAGSLEWLGCWCRCVVWLVACEEISS